MKNSLGTIGSCVAIVLLALSALTHAQSGDADLAQQLTNPVADIVTVPIQMNFDQNIGPLDDGTKFTANIQPVIPFDISED